MLVDTQGKRGRELLRSGPGAAGALLSLAMTFAASWSGGDAFKKAPLLLRESLLFPYLKGLTLCWRLAEIRKGTWEGVNSAFRDPPLSTEQVIHPEKYTPGPGRDEPVALSFPGGGPLDPGAWEVLKENVLGELQIEVLFRQKLGRGRSEAAAGGWDGDLYRVYRRKEDPRTTCLVWVSEWDTEGEARDFHEAARTCLASAVGPDEACEAVVDGRRVTIAIGPLEGGLTARIVRWAGGFTSEVKKIRFEAFKASVEFPRKDRRF